MEPRSVMCVGCGAPVPDIAGPTHPYMEASPGCWQAYGEVLAVEYSDPSFRAVQRLTADTYAVQHPGRPSPRAIQSVCGHLLSLCLILETHASLSFGERGILWAVQNEDQLRWLSPPSSMGKITVVDIQTSGSAAEHDQQVRAWAESAWSAWAEHHDTVRTWATNVLDAR